MTPVMWFVASALAVELVVVAGLVGWHIGWSAGFDDSSQFFPEDK